MATFIFTRSILALASMLQLVAATGSLYGLPVLNGPIPVTPQVLGSKSRVGEFVHPGLWHTHDDLERIRVGVENNMEPWKSAYANFSTDQYSQSDVSSIQYDAFNVVQETYVYAVSQYVMQGPKSVICRGSCNNYTTFSNDARAAYQNSLMWYITKNQSHWNRATTILDAWGTNLTSIIGVDTSLLIGLEGALLVNAAEIMRWEGGWVESGARPIGSSGFSNQLYWLLARQSIIIGQANYGMVSIKALLGFAVYLDDVTMVCRTLGSTLNRVVLIMYSVELRNICLSERSLCRYLWEFPSFYRSKFRDRKRSRPRAGRDRLGSRSRAHHPVPRH